MDWNLFYILSKMLRKIIQGSSSFFVFFWVSLELYGFIKFFLQFCQGDNVPPPFTSFSSTGFPSEILREVSASIPVFYCCHFFNSDS